MTVWLVTYCQNWCPINKCYQLPASNTGTLTRKTKARGGVFQHADACKLTQLSRYFQPGQGWFFYIKKRKWQTFFRPFDGRVLIIDYKQHKNLKPITFAFPGLISWSQALARTHNVMEIPCGCHIRYPRRNVIYIPLT